ncbi:MAG: glycosyltransferase [Sphingomonadaceae bacterium]|nr:glycosyltransferase [Sphingomonadaceae bacterium]
MIRVAHLVPSMAVGGRERIVADLCRTAAPHGIDPIVITYDPVPGSAELDPVAPIVALERRRRGFPATLVGTLQHRRIDLLHAQGHVAAALARHVTRAMPMVATLHIALGSGWRWLPAIARGLRAADAVTAVSGDLARQFGWIAGRRIATIPTGVDLARFAASTALRPDAPFTIGIAARLHPVKRHADAIAALRLVEKRGRRCRLLIAGEGPLHEEIARAGAGLDVRMLGPVADMASFYRRLDALLLPSDHEGTPAALLEAMACGLPCIATTVGGVPALATGAALLVPARDPVRLAEAIARLMVDASLRARLGTAAAARAADYSLAAQADAYAALYRDVLAARRPQRDPKGQRLGGWHRRDRQRGRNALRPAIAPAPTTGVTTDSAAA